MVKLFGVHPGYRRRGIASALFDRLEANLAQRGVQEVVAGALGPNFFEPGVNVMNTHQVCFLLQRGYSTDRATRINMEVDLDRAPLDTAADVARLAAEGIILRRAQPDEVAAAAQFAKEHFSEGWRWEVAETARRNPPSLYLAVDERAPAAPIVSFGAYDVSGNACFGPTGTLPSYRQRGIGGALLKLCLRDIRDRGESVAEICWVGPVQFYADAVGARISQVYWQFTKKLSVPGNG